MKLSILDQSPVSVGMTEKEALEMSIRLAKHGESLDYERYWIAEHHDLFGLACPNPGVMLGAIGAHTSTIRIGAGAVLLPYYKPYHVAETYNLLATLYPGRIDLGLGRAPGGPAEVSLALADNYLKEVRDYPNKVTELQSFLDRSFPKDNLYHNISPTPIPEEGPLLWMLGTSEKSAKLAAEKGLSYAFGHFMTDKDGPEIVQEYRLNMGEHHPDEEAYVTVALSAICAETTEEANDLALSQCLWKIRQETLEADVHIPSVEEAKEYEFTPEEIERVEAMKNKMIIGNPEEVHAELMKLDEQYAADEYMIVTIVHEEAAKLKSYALIKQVADQA